MPTRLPPHPDLTQLKRQAKELKRAHRERTPSAAARIAAHHPRAPGQSLHDVLEWSLRLADAQLVLAREYGFGSWAQLKHHVELGTRIARLPVHPHFDEALAALDAGAADRLRALVHKYPDVVRARGDLDRPYGYFTGATLLHHIAWNPGRDAPIPSNVAEVARVLLDAGADVHATTLGPNGGTTMGLLMTSKQASDANVSAELIDLLLEYGATLDLTPGASSEPADVLHGSLANHAPRAAEKLIALGAPVDVGAAGALGRMDLLHDCFDAAGRLRIRPRRSGRAMAERDAIGLALLLAYVNGHADAVDYLLQHQGNWDISGVNNGTVLHRAAWDGDLPMVQRLVARGAVPTNRDNPFRATALSWAHHNRQVAVFDWMRAHCAIDLHDAVSFDLREHVTARLHEDPAGVNAVRDHWQVPRSAPLHWAAWPHVEDAEGRHSHDPVTRAELVTLLLDHGADPNLVAGNGLTALDIALAGGAAAVATILERSGGTRAADLEPISGNS